MSIPGIKQVVDKCRSGGDLTRLISIAKDQTAYAKLHHPTQQVAIIFSAGICSLTTKIHGHNQEEVYYNTENDIRAAKVVEVKSQFADLLDLSAENAIPIVITNIYPVDLKQNKTTQIKRRKLATSRWSDEQTAEQQAKLEEDIKY